MPIKILLVDDEEEKLMLYRNLLEHEHYDVKTAHNGTEALAILERFDPLIALLDVVLGDPPRMDGMDLCHEIRWRSGGAYKQRGIILFTDKRKDPEYVVSGLQCADKYLPRPVHPHVLLLEIKALIRLLSGNTNVQEKVISVDPWLQIDLVTHTVLVGEQKKLLQEKLLNLLIYLAQRPNQACSKDDILMAIWKDVNYEEGVLTTAIRRLRQEIEPDPNKPAIYSRFMAMDTDLSSQAPNN